MLTLRELLREREIINEMKTSLEDITDALSYSQIYAVKYLAKYPSWRETRSTSIGCLEEFANSIEKRTWLDDVSEFAQDVIGSITDGIDSIVQSIRNSVEPRDSLRKKMIKEDQSDRFEKNLEELFKQLNTVKSFLIEDEKKTSKLTECVESVTAFKKMVEKIIKFDIFLKIMENSIKNENDLSYTPKIRLQRFAEEVIDSLPLANDSESDLTGLVFIFHESLDCWHQFDFLMRQIKTNPLAFQFASLLSQFFGHNKTLEKMLTLVETKVIKLEDEGNFSTKGIFFASNVVFHNMNLIKSTNDIRKINQVKFVNEIRQYAAIMRQELLAFDGIYNRLSKFTMSVKNPFAGSKDSDNITQFLKALVEEFDLLEIDIETFLFEYPSWSKQREKSIECLDKLASSLETWRRATNYSKLVGDTVGLIGDVVVVAAAIKGYHSNSLNFSEKMIKRGQHAGIAGSLITAGTAVVEDVVLYNKAKEAKRILIRDEEAACSLLSRMKPINKFKDIVEKIMEFDVFYNFINDFMSYICTMKENNISDKIIAKHLPNFLIEITASLSKDKKEYILEFASVIYDSIDCCRWFNILIKLNKKNPLVFQFVRALSTLPLRGKNFMKNPLSSLGLTAIKYATSKSGTNGVSYSEGILSAANIPIRAIGLVTTVQSLKEGSQSELTDDIRQCSSAMREELIFLKSIFNMSSERQYNAK